MQQSEPRETDSRFPSGRWIGFWKQPSVGNARGDMEIELNFGHTKIWGEGRDVVGEFLFRGRYDLESGECSITKNYIGGHDVYYRGFNEGKGIWGTWEITAIIHAVTYSDRGGFHIWPEAIGDPTQSRLSAEVPIPADEELVLICD